MRARLGISVKRDGDARQDAEDRHHDHELGECDSALGTRCALILPGTSHPYVSSGAVLTLLHLTLSVLPPQSHSLHRHALTVRCGDYAGQDILRGVRAESVDRNRPALG